jgi:hypothetical protein
VVSVVDVDEHDDVFIDRRADFRRSFIFIFD